MAKCEGECIVLEQILNRNTGLTNIDALESAIQLCEEIGIKDDEVINLLNSRIGRWKAIVSEAESEIVRLKCEGCAFVQIPIKD